MQPSPITETAERDVAQPDVAWTDETVPVRNGAPVAVRVYRGGAASRSAPVVLHLHSGAFVMGDLDSGPTV